MSKRRIMSLTAIAIVLCMALSLAAMAAGSDTDSSTDEAGATVVRTWKNENGETMTGIITQGTSVLSACTNPGDGQARGFVTGAKYNTGASPYTLDEREVSDYFYLQIYNNKNEVVTKYKVTLTGVVSRVNSDRRITSVTFSRVFGDTCVTSYTINGHTATAEITHPIEKYFSACFVLGTGGAFTVITEE